MTDDPKRDAAGLATGAGASIAAYRPRAGSLRWREVTVVDYKPQGAAPFRGVSRQVLFDDPSLAAQLRYFEVAPGGHTTLERHEHAHAVVVQHGCGRCLVGERLYDLALHDLVHVPEFTWHQFRATTDAPLGFLCMVNAVRDRPRLPTDDDLARLRANPLVAAFIVV